METRNRPSFRPATANEVVGLVGELEPLTLAKVLATGATVPEVAAALSAIEDEDGFGEIHHEPLSAREAEVRALLEDLVSHDDDEPEPETEPS